MYTCGIDIGSVSSEAVILQRDDLKKDDKNFSIIAYIISSTGGDSKEAAEKVLGNALNKAGLKREQIYTVTATGYGRINVPFADKNITEISCHARGVISYFPDIKTVIDIGGQDSKVIKLDSRGNPIDFLMNDKCAAGTGRFLEVMAKALEIDLSHFGEIFTKTSEKVDISSTCTVFAESEIVSLVGHGVDKNKIIKGLVYSISNRIISMVERIGLEEPVCITGGVAKNFAVVRALEELLSVKIYVPEEPQITGALGAALLA
ncbi:MAG: 2-hydroxyglutaryl-CoA dehydratase [Actinobacteria bacterium]|nr:2-hydroxyglutaryl-CoA dehydratase [Actinomycetota bacterium]MBM3712952.1 2-hydroxyglutaryl-CoA dehydratase [Actinomycetota bacterium]